MGGDRTDGLAAFDLGPFQTNRILVVDDEREHLTVLRRLLEDEYEVLTALDGERGLEIVERETLDAILADQRMPGMTGVEMLGRCARIQPDAVRIMLTAFSDSSAIMDAIEEFGSP